VAPNRRRPSRALRTALEAADRLTPADRLSLYERLGASLDEPLPEESPRAKRIREKADAPPGSPTR
jgi:hypothetical protein